MKNLFLALLLAASVISFMSCGDEEIVLVDDNIEEATILGRWKAVGFDDVIRYEFTENKRFDIYGNGDGTFPTLEEFMQENPQLTGLDWEYDGETVVVDLNFGNYSRLIPNFDCDNKVVHWTNEDGSEHSTFYRESHDISDCN